MAKVAVMLGPLFEDVEHEQPVEAFKAAGHEVEVVGMEVDKELTGKQRNVTVTVDRAFSETSADDYDALLIPGGYSPDQLRVHQEALDFLTGFIQQEKPVFAICHAGQLFISAKLAEGRRITGWPSIKQDLIYAGADFVDAPVVVDDNLISSRGPDDIAVFNDACLSVLEKIDEEREV